MIASCAEICPRTTNFIQFNADYAHRLAPLSTPTPNRTTISPRVFSTARIYFAPGELSAFGILGLTPPWLASRCNRFARNLGGRPKLRRRPKVNVKSLSVLSALGCLVGLLRVIGQKGEGAAAEAQKRRYNNGISRKPHYQLLQPRPAT